MVRGDGVLTGGECNSWPLCYNSTYMRDARYRRCLAHHAGCFPNSGTYLGLPRPLLGFVDGLRRTLAQLKAQLDHNESLDAPQPIH